MKERPILFSAPMVRALLNGSKTQTRRIVKPQPLFGDVGGVFASWQFPTKGGRNILYPNAKDEVLALSPYGQPGDRLWVRENIYQVDSLGETEVKGQSVPCDKRTISYATDGQPSPPVRMHPSIHMPRWACRIMLEITGVRVERLQDISEADARAEGARECDPITGREVLLAGHSQRGSYVLHYRDIWETINGAGSWDQNPWVWVVTFKPIVNSGVPQ